MEVTRGEKIIMEMIADLYKQLGLKGNIDPDLVLEAIYSDHFWALEWDRADSDSLPQDVKDTLDILGMYTQLEAAYERFSDIEKKELDKAAYPYGDPVRFEGFDGNNEARYLSIADKLINKLDVFSNFQGRDLNSHAISYEPCMRMLQEYLPLKKALVDPLSVDQMAAILKARKHPD